MPTPENELEEYSTKMMEAAHRIQARGTQVPQGTQRTQVGDTLSKVSQECIDVATELKKETQTLTKRYQKGKLFKAVYSALRAESHKTKLNQLNESLKTCKEVMETELLLKICDQDTAIVQKQNQGFRSLEIDVQNLILKIAEGFTRVEQLVSIEAQATRDAIYTHVTSEFKALGIRNISDNQHQRLLKSLKPEEIRERHNSVLPSSDACFERVFASYERVCRQDPEYKAWDEYEQEYNDGSDDEREKARFEEEVDEIDHIWEGFSTWLQSDDKLFWIRGKPGSGKSTLIKFVINSDNTKRLLGSWQPNTKLLSHFFWKIGSEPQNSIKGLLCSLLHDLLLEDVDAINEVLKKFKFSQEKDFYKEWSSNEAEEILLSILDAGAHSTCIFIDGLDEISNKDGYRALLSVVQKLTIYQSADLPLKWFTRRLLHKAQRVFLWLALATKSVINRIMNGDDQETLSQRLEELPDELEALYQTMWERLNGRNRVYRETAAKYFRFVMANGWNTDLHRKDGRFYHIPDPNLAQLSLAIRAEDRLIFPPKGNEKTLSELNSLCAATEGDIQTRCAGMLQVGRHSVLHNKGAGFCDAIYPLTRPVLFIHRTAHDFLIDTEAGQSIVNYKSNETTGLSPDAMLEILRTIRDLYENGALDNREGGWELTRSFPCVAAYNLTSCDDFVISSFIPTPSPELATDSLHELALATIFMTRAELPVRIIRGMVDFGAGAHVAKRSDLSFELMGHQMHIIQHTTAFESLLFGVFYPRLAVKDPYIRTRSFLEVIETLIQTCPDLHRRVILFFGQYGFLEYHKLHSLKLWIAVEVDLQFLINQLLVVADLQNIPTEFNDRTREIAASFTKPYVRLRHIVRRQREDLPTQCYRVLDQGLFLDNLDISAHLIELDNVFGRIMDAVDVLTDTFTLLESSLPSESIEKVPIEEEMGMLIQEGIGLYREEDATKFCVVI
ncbi:hypothetical protein LZL87_008638 [Fusarium oxysporum]|nr:hypothetical protein LZL87_008638 [Fusarium oxysporum]